MTLPTTMTAIGMTAPGGPEVLVPVTRPLPVPSDGQILVRVHAAGVNRPDVMQRQGKYPPPPGAPDIIGLEIAGEIVARGDRATRSAIGEKVVALVAGGGYAEFCAVHETNALPVPKGFSMVEAAAIPEAFFTVWSNLFVRGRLSAGEVALIHGGASGIGTTAIQLAKAFGATVFTTVRTAEKAAAVTKLGADHAILYKDNDWAAETKKLSGGVDVVLDMVAGDYVPKNLSLLKQDGRCVIIALQGGASAMISAGLMMVNRLTLTGSTLRPQSIANKGRMAQGLKEKAWPLLEKGTIKPIIFKTFALKDAALAHAELERADHVGKVMLTV